MASPVDCTSRMPSPPCDRSSLTTRRHFFTTCGWKQKSETCARVVDCGRRPHGYTALIVKLFRVLLMLPMVTLALRPQL
jgi:hypothetical protein